MSDNQKTQCAIHNLFHSIAIANDSFKPPISENIPWEQRYTQQTQARHPKPQCSPWDPRCSTLAPWDASCSIFDPRCASEFFVAIKPNKQSDVFKSYDDATYFLGVGSHGTIHKVHPTNRVYPQERKCC